MSNERYKANRSRVYELYGIEEGDPNYNCHHIVHKKDKKRKKYFRDYDLDAKGNLCPMDKRVHEKLH